MESVGFKEWAIVCEALGDGRQSIILRKRGIAERREGFTFRHREFFLFPTYFHEQAEKTRGRAAALPKRPENRIEIRYFARVEQAREIKSWEIANALEPLHILQQSVVRERFDYDNVAGLHAALVRIFRLKSVWILPNDKSFGGCRSWVRLPRYPSETQFEPVLTDAEHSEQRKRFCPIVGHCAIETLGSARVSRSR